MKQFERMMIILKMTGVYICTHEQSIGLEIIGAYKVFNSVLMIENQGVNKMKRTKLNYNLAFVIVRCI